MHEHRAAVGDAVVSSTASALPDVDGSSALPAVDTV